MIERRALHSLEMKYDWIPFHSWLHKNKKFSKSKFVSLPLILVPLPHSPLIPQVLRASIKPVRTTLRGREQILQIISRGCIPYRVNCPWWIQRSCPSSTETRSRTWYESLTRGCSREWGQQLKHPKWQSLSLVHVTGSVKLPLATLIAYW